MPEAVIVSTARSPIGRANKGSLTQLRPDDLTATIIRAALDKIPALDPEDVDDLYLGAGGCPRLRTPDEQGARMPEAVIVSTARSPIGRANKGSLTQLRPDDLTATIIRAALDKIPALDPQDIDDLYLGCGLPGGESGNNMARVVAILLGYDRLPGATITRYCSSSVQTSRMAFHAIKAGEGDVFVSAGVETVSRFAKGTSDHWPDTHNPRFADAEARTKKLAEGGQDWADPRESGDLPDIYVAMGQTAENVARLRGLSRQELDEFAVRSQNLAEKAINEGFWVREITPVSLPDGSAVVRTLDAALPQPPSLLAQVRRLFNRFGFPDVFSGIPPLPAEPVRPPSQEEARAAAEAAASSTVQVIGPACDVIQEGSGFVAADGYVVTNAHVVAGMDDPEVRSAVGGSADATTVLFDPDLDLAVLSVPNASGPPLPLATEPLDRGAPGAILGYPQGGPLDVRRAAVRRTFANAVGRDIYGHGEVDREVLELQTLVRPGNSGGPFVLPDGRVGGVVFAASSTDEGVGYAIASGEVDDILQSAIGRTSEVDTGPCIG